MLRIRHVDTDWHDPFFDAVEAIFGCGATFRRWIQLAGWNDDYEVFALADGRQLTSIIGVMNMHFLFDGVKHEGVQLGAVGTRPGYRRQGLSRKLMNSVLEDHRVADRPVILFANETVLDFYPKFGFFPVAQKRFLLSHRIEPLPSRIRRLDVTALADRALLADSCARAAAVNSRFAARNYFPSVLWHLVHSPREVILMQDTGAILVVSRAEGWLIVHDVFAPNAIDLLAAAASAIKTPADGIEFCFDPQEWLPMVPDTLDASADDSCFLLWKGSVATENSRFPDLAHT